jgi:cyclopropane fatty-acyl-phospholipid synthase-like methyltransferase
VVWELPNYSFYPVDVESLRMHYAMTTDCWARNFEKVASRVEEKYGEKFVCMWRLYLVGCTSFRLSGLDKQGFSAQFKGLQKHIEQPVEKYQYTLPGSSF